MKHSFLLRRSFIAALALLPLLAATAVAKPKNLSIGSIRYAGTGTPQGTVGQSISNDRKTFTLIFDHFVAATGPSIAESEAAKDSAITLKFQGDPGGGHASLVVDVRGYVQLPDGATATITIRLRQGPSGEVIGSESTDTFDGPTARDYLLRRDFDLNPSAWSSPESEGAVVEVLIAIWSPDDEEAQSTVDSVDGKLIP